MSLFEYEKTITRTETETTKISFGEIIISGISSLFSLFSTGDKIDTKK